jgi:hypothetical protein
MLPVADDYFLSQKSFENPIRTKKRVHLQHHGPVTLKHRPDSGLKKGKLRLLSWRSYYRGPKCLISTERLKSVPASGVNFSFGFKMLSDSSHLTVVI